MMENPKKQASTNRIKMLKQSIILINELGFNLCVVSWSPVVRSVTYFEMGVSY